mgnify:FL=1
MTFFSRTRLLIGIGIVLLIVFGLFVYLNYSMSNITSKSAQLDSDQYVVSVDSGGTVAKQYIRVGDRVQTGDPLFEIKSPSLQAEISAKRKSVKDLLYKLTPEDNILLQAANSGVVRNVQFAQGSYVPDNAQLATLTIDDTDYVTAKYSLNAPDYARINRKHPLKVTLPDNTTLDAKVFDIVLERNGDKVLTVVKARFDKNAHIPATFSNGTPVLATWELEYNSLYKSIAEWAKSVLQSSA